VDGVPVLRPVRRVRSLVPRARGRSGNL
jgi:hypothetical protein